MFDLGANAGAPPAAWHPEPDFRGTSTILSTCLLTMALSVWTAVHLNLPEHKKGHLQKWRKLGWLVAGLLAPELVAFNALEQGRQARQLTRFMEDLHRRNYHVPAAKPVTLRGRFRDFRRAVGDWLRLAWHRTRIACLLEPSELKASETHKPSRYLSSENTQCPWTPLHSWYAVMGGFAFDTGSSSILPEGRERVVLTPKGLTLLATHWPHLIPEVSARDIEDKSKSDSLGKLITCWQAAFFAIQCAIRLASGLSIALLELNVLGHAICALIIYAIWWKKPKDIEEPTTLRGEEADSIAALFCTLSEMGRMQAPMSGPNIGARYTKSRVTLMWTPNSPVPDYEYHWIPETLPVASFAACELMDPGRIRIGDGFWSLRLVTQVNSELHPSRSVIIDEYTVARLQAIRHHDVLVEWLEDKQSDIGIADLVSDRSWNWVLYFDEAGFSTDSTSGFLRLIAGAFVAVFLYGALHAAAWSAPFPTRLQQLLWRMGCSMIALAAPAILVVVAVIVLPGYVAFLIWQRCASSETQDALRAWQSSHRNLVLVGVTLVVILTSPVWIVIGASGMCIAVARVYLVVESFVGLAYLSEPMLRTSSWAQHVPHIT